MKKQIVLTFTAAVLSFSLVQAQGGFQRRTVEERVATVHQKLDSAMHLDAAKLTSADAIFTDYYKAQDKYREDMMAAGGQPDRDAMRAKMTEMAGDRDAKLKAVFTDAQMTQWKNDIEPSLRPQRRPQQ